MSPVGSAALGVKACAVCCACVCVSDLVNAGRKKKKDINNNSVIVVITLLVVMTRVRDNNRNVH